MIGVAGETACAGDADHEHSISTQYAINFPKQRLGFRKVLEDIVEHYAIEFGVIKRQIVSLHQMHWQSLVAATRNCSVIYVSSDSFRPIPDKISDATSYVEHRALQVSGNARIQPEIAIPKT